MNKTILVMKHEFWRHFKRRSFLFAVLGLPVLMITIGAGVVFFFNSKSDDPVGIVDQAGIVMDPTAYATIEKNSVPFEPFAEETAAHDALIEKEIQAYFVLPEDYLQTGQVTLYHNGDTFEEVTGDISDYLRTSLLSTGDPILLERFHDNSLDIRFQSLSESGQPRSELGIILPFAVGIVFLIAVFSTSGLLLQAIVDEKENRTMEILITSLTPEELMIGKVLGLVLLGFIQIGVWLGLVFIGLAIARSNIAGFPTISISPVGLFVIVAWFVPFYILIASVISSIGISITSVSEGQQIVGLTSILSMFPLYFVWLIIESPNSTFNLILSLIPFSAPLTILTRTQIATVPIWQMILSWLILAGTAALALYLNSRLLRLGMLRYGKRVSWREIRQQIGSKA